MKTNSSMRIYRISRWLYLISPYLRPLSKIFYSLNRIVFSCQIPPSSALDKSTYLLHNGLGVVIHETAVIGARTVICQNVTIGGGQHSHGSAIIGDDVLLGAGCVTLGPIKIGNHSKIGANAVVLNDVQDGCTVVGIPARIVKTS